MSGKPEKKSKSSSFSYGYIFAVLFGLGIGGLILLLNRHPKPQSIKILPTSTNAPVIVHIVGEVLHPGIYEIDKGQRIGDVIEIAGGCTEKADLEKINLASIVFDGQQIIIPSAEDTLDGNGEIIPTEVTDVNLMESPINLNYCTLEDLIALPGIGQAKAEAILAYRAENGPFLVKEDIVKVSGIGESIFDSIKNSITVK